jgi:hypothetical protein
MLMWSLQMNRLKLKTTGKKTTDHLRGIYGIHFHTNNRTIQCSLQMNWLKLKPTGKKQPVILEESMEYTSTLIMGQFSEVYRWIGWNSSLLGKNDRSSSSRNLWIPQQRKVLTCNRLNLGTLRFASAKNLAKNLLPGDWMCCTFLTRLCE